ncbi:hypothetical protein DXG03_004121 [Asterophora parasitica]|uniref:HMG box domain-containing protein n=1 Tax=Asterophora parasitica TaxID=117018 RepID=A0A9P7G306_9AGAR|nr:hypothetical protein DXG03_004121 [Asterophora parasitica]
MPPVRRRRRDEYDYSEHDEREGDQEREDSEGEMLVDDDETPRFACVISPYLHTGADMPPLVDRPDRATPMQYTFFTEMTPLSFNSSASSPPTPTAPPPLTESVSHSHTPSTASTSAPPTPQRVSHGKRRDASYIPRPPNAFILFRSSFIKGDYVPERVEGSHSNLSKIVGMYWRTLPPAERTRWETEAAHAQLEHRKRYPDWRFRPAANALAKLKVVEEDSARRRGRGGLEGAGLARELGAPGREPKAGPSRPRKRRAGGARGSGKDPPRGEEFMFVDGTELGKHIEADEEEDDDMDVDVGVDIDTEVWDGKGKGKAKAKPRARRVSSAVNDSTTSAESNRVSSSSTPQHASSPELLGVPNPRGRLSISAGMRMSSRTPRSASSSTTTRSGASTASIARRSSTSSLTTTPAAVAPPILTPKANYTSNPRNKAKTKPKTKTRAKPEPAAHDDARLVQIAEFLREGKTGTKLELAVDAWELERRAGVSVTGTGGAGVDVGGKLQGEALLASKIPQRCGTGTEGECIRAEALATEWVMKCEEEREEGDEKTSSGSGSTSTLTFAHTTRLVTSSAYTSASPSTSAPGGAPTPITIPSSTSSSNSTFAPAMPTRLGLDSHAHTFTASVSSSPITFSVPLRATLSAFSVASSTSQPQIHVHARRKEDEEEEDTCEEQIRSRAISSGTTSTTAASTPLRTRPRTSTSPTSPSSSSTITPTSAAISLSTRPGQPPAPLLLVPQHRSTTRVSSGVPPPHSHSPSPVSPSCRSRSPSPPRPPMPLPRGLSGSSSVPLIHMFKRSRSVSVPAPVPAPGDFAVHSHPPPLEYPPSPTVPLLAWQHDNSAQARHISTIQPQPTAELALAPTPFAATSTSPLTPLSAILPTEKGMSSSTPTSTTSAMPSPALAPRFTLPWQEEEDRRRMEVDAGYAAFWGRPPASSGEEEEGQMDERELGERGWEGIPWQRERDSESEQGQGEGMHEIVREGSFSLPLTSAASEGVRFPPLPAHQQRILDEETQAPPQAQDANSNSSSSTSSPMQGGEQWGQRWDGGRVGFGLLAPTCAAEGYESVFPVNPYPPLHTHTYTYPSSVPASTLTSPTHASTHTHSHHFSSLTHPENSDVEMLMAGAHFYPTAPTPISPYSSSFSSLAGWDGDSAAAAAVHSSGDVAVKPGSGDGGAGGHDPWYGGGWGAGGIQSSGLYGGRGGWETMGRDTMQDRHGDHTDG